MSAIGAVNTLPAVNSLKARMTQAESDIGDIPATDLTAITARMDAAETSINSLSSAQLVGDVDAPGSDGPFYTNATSSNRPYVIGGGYVDLIFDHYAVDVNTAIQRAYDFVNNKKYFRSMVGGVWLAWQLVTASTLPTLVIGWPPVVDDNLIVEVATTSIVGWSANAALSSDGTALTLSPTGTTNYSEYSIPVLSGDYIFYATLSGDLLGGSYCHVAIGGVGDGRLQVSLGYNWATGSAQSSRVSVRVGAVGIAGPSIDYSANEIQIAVQYDSRLGVGNLFILEAGKWVFYGGATFADPYRNTVRMTTGGNHATGVTVKDWFIAKPNIVAIGDSVTAGHNAYDPDPAHYAGNDNYQSSWMAHAQIYGNVRNNLIVNYGVGGDNTGQVNARLGAMLTATEPKVIFLSACNNDYGNGVSDAQRTINIQNSVNEILLAGASIVLYNAIYPNNDTASRDYYKNWWDVSAGSVEGVSLLVDIMLSGIVSGTDQIDPAYALDHVHPNVAGYTLIGDYIEAQEI